MKLLVVSDPHWAGPAELPRRGYEARAMPHRMQRILAAAWRKGFWLADPMAHNDKLDRILALNPDPDLVVANGTIRWIQPSWASPMTPLATVPNGA
jgi:hypothetical protein